VTRALVVGSYAILGSVLTWSRLTRRRRYTDVPEAFGFWQVQLVDDRTLLVHETFANAERREVTYGLIWTRVAS
jgi:hypothetical protein